MSEMERNKGKLVPVVFGDILDEFPNASVDDLEWDTVGNYTTINGMFYKVEWEVYRNTDCPDFAEAKQNPDGSIDFHTIHYNGGGHWTEVVEGALK